MYIWSILTELGGCSPPHFSPFFQPPTARTRVTLIFIRLRRTPFIWSLLFQLCFTGSFFPPPRYRLVLSLYRQHRVFPPRSGGGGSRRFLFFRCTRWRRAYTEGTALHTQSTQTMSLRTDIYVGGGGGGLREGIRSRSHQRCHYQAFSMCCADNPFGGVLASSIWHHSTFFFVFLFLPLFLFCTASYSLPQYPHLIQI